MDPSDLQLSITVVQMTEPVRRAIDAGYELANELVTRADLTEQERAKLKAVLSAYKLAQESDGMTGTKYVNIAN